MRLRLALAAWAGIALLHGQPTIPHTLADADRIEAQIQSSPNDLTARLMLLRYYWLPGNNVPAERLKGALREDAIWMIEHHPEHPALREDWAAILPGSGRAADAGAFEAADRAWRKHLAEPSVKADVYTNAATFYKYVDRTFAYKIAADGIQAFPGDPGVGAAAGMLYALDILHAKSAGNYGRLATSTIRRPPTGVLRRRGASSMNRRTPPYWAARGRSCSSRSSLWSRRIASNRRQIAPWQRVISSGRLSWSRRMLSGMPV